MLRLAGFLTYRVDDAEEVDDIVGAGCDMAFDGDLSGRDPAVAAADRPQEWTEMMMLNGATS